jgi:hypothetical protein
MKHLALHDEISADERPTREADDPEADLIQRTFLLAHGRPSGPVSTLTNDHRLLMETRFRVPVA